MCIDLQLPIHLLEEEITSVAQHPPALTCTSFFLSPHKSTNKVVSVTDSSLQYVLFCHFTRVCVCVWGGAVSLLGPCCWHTELVVPIKRAQGGLLWQQLFWCAVCVCLCARFVVQGRRAQFTWSRLLLCPLLSLWESVLLWLGWYSIMF